MRELRVGTIWFSQIWSHIVNHRYLFPQVTKLNYMLAVVAVLPVVYSCKFSAVDYHTNHLYYFHHQTSLQLPVSFTLGFLMLLHVDF